LAIFADGGTSSSSGDSNIYFTTDSDTSVYMIPHGGSATTAVAPVQISSIVGPNPSHMIMDANGGIWVSSGAAFVSRIATGNAGDANYLNGYTTTQFTAAANVSDVTAGPNATGTFVASDSSSNVNFLTGSGTSYSTASGWPNLSGAAGLLNPAAVAIDGRLNIWTVNGTANSGSGLFSVSEVSANGVPLMTSGTVAGGRQFDASFLANPKAITIDMSGNVWVAGKGTVANPSTSVTEIIGAAVPIYQPYSVGLSNGRFQRLP
jgi:hypothetical protein